MPKKGREVDNYFIKGFKHELYYAIHLAVVDLFGEDVYQQIEGMSGDRDPEFISILDPDTGDTIRMPMGQLSIGPMKNGRMKISDSRRRYDDEGESTENNINIKCRYRDSDLKMALEVDCPKDRKEEAELLIDSIREFAKTKSFLQGKVLKVTIDDNNDTQEVDIIPLHKITGQDVYVYSDIQEGLIPIISRLIGSAETLKINNKYSLLLHGKGGTGKTSMMFNYVSPIAVANGYTVIFCDNARNYESILDIAEVLVSERGWKVITIVEDIDQAFDGEIRGEMQQNILNKIDAGYNKDMKLINVMTTNYIDRISSFMIRAGRISKLLHVGGLPAEDVLPFCARYMGSFYDAKEDYSVCIPILTDMPASFVREIIDEAKTLAAANNSTTITSSLFKKTTDSYKHQEELTLRTGYDPKDKVIDAIRTIFDVVGLNVENLVELFKYNDVNPVALGKKWEK